MITSADLVNHVIEFFLDGGGSVISTGLAQCKTVPFDCDIVAGRILPDQSGSLQVDIWVDDYDNYPPSNSESITSSAPMDMNTATKYRDTTLTGWTTSLEAGQAICVNVDDATTVTWATIGLEVQR